MIGQTIDKQASFSTLLLALKFMLARKQDLVFVKFTQALVSAHRCPKIVVFFLFFAKMIATISLKQLSALL